MTAGLLRAFHTTSPKRGVRGEVNPFYLFTTKLADTVPVFSDVAVTS